MAEGNANLKYYRGYSFRDVMGAIDHSVLKPQSVNSEIIAAAETVHRLGNASLCIRPCDVKAAVTRLQSLCWWWGNCNLNWWWGKDGVGLEVFVFVVVIITF